MPPTVLVTGASGFVGRALITRLGDSPFVVRAAYRSRPPDVALWDDSESVVVQALGSKTDWTSALAGCEAVVHTAARVHVMKERAASPLDEFRAVNVAGTMRLAREAAKAGVGRFIFISSIKVNGEHTHTGTSFTADDACAPVDPYGISKHEAEQGLRRIAAETGLQVVIIRPVLVYGPGVKANFRSMMRWVHRGIPLPLGAIHNRRSLVAVDNLADFIVRTLTHPKAANQTFVVSDGEDLSTTELLRRTATAMGKHARLVPVPQSVLSVALRVLGKEGVANRLFESLTVDIGKNRELLGWSPPISVEQALGETVAHYLSSMRA